MKRLSQTYTINIVINVEVYEQIAAYIQELHNVNQSFDKQMANIMDNMIDTVITNIQGYDFVINNHYQSKKGYSYYINFTPCDENGNLFPNSVDVIFRIADHKNTSFSNSAKKVMVQNFVINNKEVSTVNALINEMCYILEELSKGNFNVLI